MAKLQQSPSELEQTGSTEDNDNRSSAFAPSVAVRHRSRSGPLAVVPSPEIEAVQAATEKGGGYDVGYKKPPRHSRFKKGQSGNAKGRPKGALSLRTIVTKAMNTRTSVKINGVERVMTHLEIIVSQQLKKAMTGDVKAFQLLASLLPGEESGQSDRSGSDQSGLSSTTNISASERAMLAHQQEDLLRAQGTSEEIIAKILVNMGLAP